MVRNYQEKFYRRKIDSRNEWLTFENVKRTGNMWFTFEPYWWCPWGTGLYGHHGDGVKWTCGVALLAERPAREVYNALQPAEKAGSPPPCVVYSAGSAGNSQFEDDLRSSTACEIHIFDPDGSVMSYASNDWTAKYSYHNTRVGGVHDHQTLTLEDILGKFNHTYVDILKIDIESSEFSLFENISEDALSRIGQILMEVHYIGPVKDSDSEEKLGKLTKMFYKLEANNFRIFYKEVNILYREGAEYALVNAGWHPLWSFSASNKESLV